MSRTQRREPRRRNHAWDAELLGKCHRHGSLDTQKTQRKRAKQDLQRELDQY
jgi:hypothetical protein